MSIVDLILLVLLALFAVRGYFKGLFLEVFSLLGIFTGILIAVRYNGQASHLIQGYWEVSPIILKAIGFVAIFFVVYFVCNLVGWLLQRSSRYLFLGGFNRVGGVVFGTGKGAAFLALILFLVGSSSFLPQNIRQRVDNSVLVPTLNRFGQELVELGKDTLFSYESEDQNVEEVLRPLGRWG